MKEDDCDDDGDDDAVGSWCRRCSACDGVQSMAMGVEVEVMEVILVVSFACCM